MYSVPYRLRLNVYACGIWDKCAEKSQHEELSIIRNILEGEINHCGDWYVAKGQEEEEEEGQQKEKKKWITLLT